MLLKGTRLGDVEIADEKVITFPNGILGFEKMKRFVLLTPNPSVPFHWLQSVESPPLAFVTINPLVFHPEYKMSIPEAQLRVVQGDVDTEIAVLVIVTIPEDPEKMTANMAGPLLINARNRIGIQAVLGDETYSTHHLIIKELQESGKDAQYPVKDGLEQIATHY